MGSQAAGQQHHPAQRLVQLAQCAAPTAEASTARVTAASLCLRKVSAHVSAVARPAISPETALTSTSSNSDLQPGLHRAVDLQEATAAQDAARAHTLCRMGRRSPR